MVEILIPFDIEGNIKYLDPCLHAVLSCILNLLSYIRSDRRLGSFISLLSASVFIPFVKGGKDVNYFLC
jgi:hypothetical protein